MSAKTICVRHFEHAVSQGWIKHFTDAAKQTGVPAALLMAIASRETEMGTSPLLKNWRGDRGHGRGLMQIDDRWHQAYTSTHRDDDHRSNIFYAANLVRQLQKNRITMGNLRLVAASYNCGPGGVRKAIEAGKDPDVYTTGGNYGCDVLARMKHFEDLLATMPKEEPRVLRLSKAPVLPPKPVKKKGK